MSVEKYASKDNLQRFKSNYDNEINGKISAQGVPSGGTTGQVLTKNSNGYGWDNVPTELPSSSSSDEGKVLTVNSSGNPSWANASGGGPTIYGSDVMHGGNDLFIQSIYDTTVGETVFYVLASYINASSTGKAVTEAVEDDLVICNTTQYGTYPVGIYVVDHYGTINDSGATYNALIIKSEQYMPISISRYVPPTVNGVPSGGSTGQILTKKSSGYGWADAPSSTSKVNLKNPIKLTYYGMTKSWSGLSNFNGSKIWTDGNNIYYSSTSTQYVFNKSLLKWESKSWSGLTRFDGDKVWTDGRNVYYSNGSTQKILDVATSTWSNKTWTGLTNFNGDNVWTDGDNIYYSTNSTHYVLNVLTSTWSSKTWTSVPATFHGKKVWTDGTNIYYSYGDYGYNYVLNKSTSTWSSKSWTISSSANNLDGEKIWTDGEKIYFSDGSTSYILNKSTSSWTAQTFSNGSSNISLYGNMIWTDGTTIYYSSSTTHYELLKEVSSIDVKPNITIKDTSKEVPSSTSSDSGKVLTVNSLGTPEWKSASGGLPSYSSSQSGKVLAVNYDGSSLWWRQLYCGTFVLGRNNYVNNYINNPEGATINYFEVMITATFSERNDTYSPLNDVTINISNYCYNDDHALKIMLPTQTDLCQLLINNKILPGGSGSDWIISSPQIRAYCSYLPDPD